MIELLKKETLSIRGSQLTRRIRCTLNKSIDETPSIEATGKIFGFNTRGKSIHGKYRKEHVIGSGGMGEVYKAVDIERGQKVAVKYLLREYLGNDKVVRRFQREAELARSISHDNICEVTDFDITEDGTPYLVMPLLSGCTFSDLLKSNRRLPLKRILDITCQVLAALEAAHHANIVHRDLKPSNIFITENGDQSDFVKLLDFGISKVLDQDCILDLTASGVVLGTPYYMAPEQAKGSKYIDQRVDLYAIGVILYEAFTGRKPFKGDSYNEVMYKIVSEPFPAPASLNPSMQPAIERVVLKAMARNPNDRFASAREMKKALEMAMVDRGEASNGPAITASITAVDRSIPFTLANAGRDSDKNVISDKSWARKMVLVFVILIILTAFIAGYFFHKSEHEATTENEVPASFLWHYPNRLQQSCSNSGFDLDP
ncbi:MAG: serine/threonine protein kinase [Proteobacteria bacterium]|nr:serine/threonine protein kinase [Pseudomonadota bacterium]